MPDHLSAEVLAAIRKRVNQDLMAFGPSRHQMGNGRFDRAILLAEVDRMNAEFTELVRTQRAEIAELHPALAWGNLTVGTEDIERILGRRLT